MKFAAAVLALIAASAFGGPIVLAPVTVSGGGSFYDAFGAPQFAWSFSFTGTNGDGTASGGSVSCVAYGAPFPITSGTSFPGCPMVTSGSIVIDGQSYLILSGSGFFDGNTLTGYNAQHQPVVTQAIIVDYVTIDSLNYTPPPVYQPFPTMGDYTGTFSIVITPEPGSLLLASLGLAAVFARKPR